MTSTTHSPNPDGAASRPVPERLVDAALALLAEGGVAHLTTRAACAAAGVTAPTLYHHFGTLDGLLTAALDRAFADFLAAKRALPQDGPPADALMAGWDDYVGFAAAQPRLYAAMMARVLSGADIPAARAARAVLDARCAAAAGALALPPGQAADMLAASAHAGAMLWVEARPDAAATLAVLRAAVARSVLGQGG